MIIEREKRKAGILLPVSALPGRYGIGDFGLEARKFIDWLVRAGVKQWSVLPLNPTSFGNSPYQSTSAFAGNINNISPDILVKEKLLKQEETEDFVENTGQIDYGRLFERRPKLLRGVYDRFCQQGGQKSQNYLDFCKKYQKWLDDYAAFMALKEKMNYLQWWRWPSFLADKKEPEYSRYMDKLQYETGFWKFIQYEFFRQWNSLKEYADGNGIEIIGDMPFYIAPDSADVWSHRELFEFCNEKAGINVFAGVPADVFSGCDRNWGNPVYMWETHKNTDYEWFRQRINVCADMYDVLRIDHVIAIMKYYGIKDGEKRGKWYDGPDIGGKKLSDAICEEAEKSRLLIIAEDLGVIPPGLREMMHENGWAGTRVLQFAFTGKYGAQSNHLPFFYSHDMVVYTGTHDNPTLREFLSDKTEDELRYVKYWTGKNSLDELIWAIIGEAYKSVANQVIIPIQDILGLGREARMVFSDSYENSWKWRIKDINLLNIEIADRLKSLAVITGRYDVGKQEFFQYLK